MTWLVWRQYRVQAAIAAGLLAAFAVRAARHRGADGVPVALRPHRVHGGSLLRFAGGLPVPGQPRRYDLTFLSLAVPGGARAADRRAARRRRGRNRHRQLRLDAEHHPRALAAGQGRLAAARRRRLGRLRRRPGHLVVGTAQRALRQRVPGQRLRHAGHRPDRLRGVRRGARHRGGRAAAPDAAGHRRHPGRVRRGARAGRPGPPGALPDRGDHLLQPDQQLAAGLGILGARQRPGQQVRARPRGPGHRREPERHPSVVRGRPGERRSRPPARSWFPTLRNGDVAGPARDDHARAARRAASPPASRRRASGSSASTSRSAATGRSSRSRPSSSWRSAAALVAIAFAVVRRRDA